MMLMEELFLEKLWPECLKDLKLQRRLQEEGQGLKRVIKLHVYSLQKHIKSGP